MLQLAVWVGSLLTPLHHVFPQSSAPVEEVSDIHVTWYRPDYTDEARKGLKGVVVSGKTAPGLRVYLGGTRITKYIDEQNVQFVQMTRDTVAHLPATTDRFGLFYFQIFLDQGNYQIPIVVQDPEVPGPKGIKRYQLIFLVEEDRIRMGRDEAEQKSLAVSPFFKRANRFSVGYGVNYLTYHKTVPSLEVDVTFKSAKAPAFFIDYWHRFNPLWELALSYKSAPGSTTSSEEVTVLSGDYSWDIATFDFMYFPGFLFFEKPGYRLRLGARLGFQHHWVPFVRSATTGNDHQEVAMNPVSMIAAGVQAEYETSPEWRYEAFLRYQHPVAVGDVFELAPKIAFDGSLGVQYNFPNYRWALGFFWYGQLQQYGFTEFDKATSQVAAGDQSLFFSNMEIRLQHNF